MRRVFALAAVTALAAGMLSPGTGAAQGTPSADQILKSLTPTNTTGTTRGIRIAPTTQAAPSQPASPSQAAEPAGAASINLMVQFASGSASLTPNAIRTLNELGRALSDQSLAVYRFRIEGHTDTVGSPAANKALSDRRAATVVEYLVTNFHIDAARLQPVGMGEDQLLIATPDQTPEPRNRRVQVVNLGS